MPPHSDHTRDLLGYEVPEPYDAHLSTFQNIGPEKAVIVFADFLCCLAHGHPSPTCRLPTGSPSIFLSSAANDGDVTQLAPKVLRAFYDRSTALDTTELKKFLSKVIDPTNAALRTNRDTKILPHVTTVDNERFSWFVYDPNRKVWITALTHFHPTTPHLPCASHGAPAMVGPVLSSDYRVQIRAQWMSVCDLLADAIHLQRKKKTADSIELCTGVFRAFFVDIGKRLGEKTTQSDTIDQILRQVGIVTPAWTPLR